MRKLLLLLLLLFGCSLATHLIHAEHNPNPVMVEGDEAYKAGHYDLAIAKFTEVINREPKNALAYTDRALAYKEKKEYARAIADFNKALGLKPEWYVYHNRGITYQQMAEHDKAIADFSKAFKMGPADHPLHAYCLLARAHSYFDQEKAEPAMRDLNAVIKLGVKEPDAYVLRGILHKINHDYARSLADYEKAISLDPKDARSYDVEAFLLSACPMPKYRDGKKAIAYATKACELTQWKDLRSIETLAGAYAEAGQFDEAIKWQTKAAEVDSKEADEKRLALYRQKQPFRDLNRKEEPVANLANIQDKVVVKFGHKISVKFQVNGDQLVDPKLAPSEEKNRNSLTLDFRQDKRGRTLFLVHSFPRTMQARCLALLKGYDTYFETDILPVPRRTINPEIWTEPIEELVLFAFKLSGKPIDEPANVDLAGQ